MVLYGQNNTSKYTLPQIEEEDVRQRQHNSRNRQRNLFGIQSSNRYDDSADEHDASSDYNGPIGNDISQAMELFASHHRDIIKDRVKLDD